MPTVMMGIFVEQPTPFLREFFENIAALDYPKQRMDVLIHSAVSSYRIFKSCHEITRP